jgi:2-oxoglutarate ferredoxin oxidoreductase subunit beta
MEPGAATDWLKKEMIPVFPLGEIKNTLDDVGAAASGGAK